MTRAFEKSRAKKFSETNNQSNSVTNTANIIVKHARLTLITPKHPQIKNKVIMPRYIERRSGKRNERWGESNLTNSVRKKFREPQK